MTELNLPTLSLFNKTASSRRQTASRPYESPFKDILRETSRIDEQVYAPCLPYRTTLYDQEYQQELEARDAVKLQYLTAYHDALRKTQGSTHHADPAVSFRQQPSHPCHCESDTLSPAPKLKPIAKTPYLSQQYKAGGAVVAAQQKEAKGVLTKNVYLEGRKKQREEQPDVSIIQRINKSLLETENNNNPGNISKMINDSNVMRTNQSIMVEAPAPQRKQVSEQVQTEETGNRSFMFTERRVKMDQANFHKTIRDLNLQISNLSLDLNSEDVVIDLSDLVNTKNEYFEESKEILSSLQALSDERASNSIMVKSKRHGDMIWPQF